MFCDGECKKCGLNVEVVKSDAGSDVRYKDYSCAIKEMLMANLQIRDHLLALRQEENKQRNEIAGGFNKLAMIAAAKKMKIA